MANQSPPRADEAASVPSSSERAELLKKIGDMIHDHTVLNMEWGPLGYDTIARDVIIEVARVTAAPDFAAACGADLEPAERQTCGPLSWLLEALKEAVRVAGQHRIAALDFKFGRHLGDGIPSDEDWYAFQDRARAAIAKATRSGEVA